MVAVWGVEAVCTANGDSFRFMMINLLRGGLAAVAMIVGAQQFGIFGMILGLGIAQIAVYPFLAATASRYKMWLPHLDLTLLAITISWLFVMYAYLPV
jgi:hypothetical protein